MKWYQVDSDTPNDPKIKALMRRGLVEGGKARARDLVGQVFLLWCYVANHGEGEPGMGMKADGSPLPLDEMAGECLLADPAELRRLLNALAEIGLISRRHWDRGVVFLPGMLKRADTYAKRKGRGGDVRTLFEHVRTKTPESPLQDKTIQDNTEDQTHGPDGPPAGLLAGADQVDALVKVWNAVRQPGPHVREITPERRRAYGKALQRYPDLTHWKLVIQWFNGQAWCNAPGTGSNPTWRATLDYLARPGAMAKYLERVALERAAPGAQGRNAAAGRTGAKRGIFAAALKGDDSGGTTH